MNELSFYKENRSIFPDIWYQFENSNLKNYGLKGNKYDITNYQNDIIILPTDDILYEIALNSEQFVISFTTKFQTLTTNDIIKFTSDGNPIITVKLRSPNNNSVEFVIGNGTMTYDLTVNLNPNTPNWLIYNNYEVMLYNVEGTTNQKKLDFKINGSSIGELIIYNFSFNNLGSTLVTEIGSSSLRFKDLRLYMSYFDDENLLHNIHNAIFDNNYGTITGATLIDDYYNFTNSSNNIEISTSVKNDMIVENGFTIMYDKRYNSFTEEQYDIYMDNNYIEIKTLNEEICFKFMDYEIKTVTGLYDGFWYNLGFSVKLTLTELELKIWIDGYELVSKSHKNVSITEPSITKVLIGSNGILRNVIDIDIKDVKIFKKELTSKEVYDLYIGKEKIKRKTLPDINTISRWIIPSFNLKIDGERLENNPELTGILNNYSYIYPDLLQVSKEYPGYLDHSSNIVSWYKGNNNLKNEIKSGYDGKVIGGVLLESNIIRWTENEGYIEFENLGYNEITSNVIYESNVIIGSNVVSRYINYGLEKEFILNLENTFSISYWDKLYKNTSNFSNIDISIDNSINIERSYLKEITVSNLVITSNYSNLIEIIESNIVVSDIWVTCNVDLVDVTIDSYNIKFSISDIIGSEKSEINLTNEWDDDWHHWCLNLKDGFKVNVYKDGYYLGEAINSRLETNYNELNNSNLSVKFGKKSKDVALRDIRIYDRNMEFLEIQQTIEHIYIHT